MNLDLYHPKQWGSWLLLLLLRVVTLLPFTLQIRLGKALGQIGYRLLKRRAHIARTNLSLAFSERSNKEIERLVRQHFESLGSSFFEATLGWWGSKRQLQCKMDVEGLEHLDQALQQGKGVVLFSAHFTTLDLSGIMLATLRPIHAVYRPNENPVFDRTIRQGRERLLQSTIPRDNIRQMIRLLKGNGVVWYAMDQNFGHKGSVYADFFGIPAATNTATSRLVKMTGATGIPFFAHRRDGRYRLQLLPAVEMDGSDPQQETDHLNQLIEKAVCAAPAQYLWIHRRYKDRPDGRHGSLYST